MENVVFLMICMEKWWCVRGLVRWGVVHLSGINKIITSKLNIQALFVSAVNHITFLRLNYL